MWDIFVTVPGMSAPIRITMEEVLYMYVFSDKYNHDNNVTITIVTLSKKTAQFPTFKKFLSTIKSALGVSMQNFS